MDDVVASGAEGRGVPSEASGEDPDENQAIPPVPEDYFPMYLFVAVLWGNLFSDEVPEEFTVESCSGPDADVLDTMEAENTENVMMINLEDRSTFQGLDSSESPVGCRQAAKYREADEERNERRRLTQEFVGIGKRTADALVELAANSNNVARALEKIAKVHARAQEAPTRHADKVAVLEKRIELNKVMGRDGKAAELMDELDKVLAKVP